MTTVELPSGVKHYTTTCFAETDQAFDLLSRDDGWEYASWHYDPNTGERVPYTSAGSRVHRSKSAEIAGKHITVFPPIRVAA